MWLIRLELDHTLWIRKDELVNIEREGGYVLIKTTMLYGNELLVKRYKCNQEIFSVENV